MRTMIKSFHERGKNSHPYILAVKFLVEVCLCSGLGSLRAQNVGIGIPNPTQRLDVAGNVQFSGALMPGGNPGAAGDVLRSQGPNQAPVWVPMAASLVYQGYLPSTGGVCINNPAWTTHPGCSVTLSLQAGDRVWVWAYGSAMADNDCNGLSDAVWCIFDTRIAVNNAFFPNGAFTRTGVATHQIFTSFVNMQVNGYSLGGVYTVPTAGNYTFELQTSRLMGSGNALTAGDASSALQSSMMVMVFRP
ncbi:MAG: hypothetical protein ACUVRD_04370 [Bacteroidia bacterium]